MIITDSNQLSEEKQESNDSNIVEDNQNTEQELNDSSIVEDSQNAQQELNESNIADHSQSANNKEISIQNLNCIKRFRDEEKSCKEYIKRRMKHATVRNNKDTNNILKLENQEAKPEPFEEAHKELMEDAASEKKTGEEMGRVAQRVKAMKLRQGIQNPLSA